MEITKKDAIRKLWQKGIVHWLLNDTQMDLYNHYKNATNRIVTFLCSRRLGKSYSLSVIATETCLQKPNSIVKMLFPTQKMARTTIVPIMRTILETCPKDLKPEFLKNEGIYKFPNGSEIQFAGNDANNVEKLRGGAANLCIVDEAGFCDDLSYGVRSVLMPTVTTTQGKIILSSTPSKTLGHEFINFVKQAEYDDSLVKKTIYDNKMFSPEMVKEIEDSYGGAQNSEFRREYMCEIITDQDSAVVPEFSEEVQKEIIVEHPRPRFYDYYVSADLGFKDLTAVLFGYLDFKAGKLIIEDELVMSRMTTEDLANAITKKEDLLLTDPRTYEKKEPYLRVSDVNWFIINDLQKLHGLSFLPTMKDDKEASINNMRIMIASKKILINPKCKNLIFHLRNGVWKKSRKDFDRSPDAGHYDFIDALLYMVRNVHWNRNPYPANYQYEGSHYQIVNKDSDIGEAYRKLGNIFKIKRSL